MGNGSGRTKFHSVPETKLILNLTRGATLCERGVLADRPLRRMRGLLGRRALPSGEGLLLRPAPAIHTAFMRFDIDAVFLDSDLRVVRVVEGLRPWRAAGQRGAKAVLELAAGECARRRLALGDQLALRGGNPASVLVVSDDHRFRTVSLMLLGRRGCSVAATSDAGATADAVKRECADVVVLDADELPGAAVRAVTAVEELTPPVGVVVVAQDASREISGRRVLAKWGPFEALFAAIEESANGRSKLERTA
jgi:uncharacterized membrane protein (UPF0127 family)/CheY-like chemotaxis protein